MTHFDNTFKVFNLYSFFQRDHMKPFLLKMINVSANAITILK